jgi:hypothetical protein
MNVGDQLLILLHAPAHDPSGKEEACVFRCEGRVVRVEPADVEGAFGIACHIDDYAVARTSDSYTSIRGCAASNC